MLVVKVELWPDGDRALRSELGRAAIANVTELTEISNYLVMISDKGGNRLAYVRRHRRSMGFWPLISRALSARASRIIPLRLASTANLMRSAVRDRPNRTS